MTLAMEDSSARGTHGRQQNCRRRGAAYASGNFCQSEAELFHLLGCDLLVTKEHNTTL